MAPVIWGLDLKEMQWSKFGSKYMFGNREYHQWRRNYIGQQPLVKHLNCKAYVYNNDYVGIASYNIFAGVFVAFIFGAAFLFDLLWPERHESKGVRTAWKVCGVLAVLIHLASALATTLITATRQAYVTGLSNDDLAVEYRKDHTTLNYRHNPRALAAVVFAWLGWVSIVPSCVLLFLSIDNTERGPGPREEAHLYANTGRHSTATAATSETEKELEKPVQEPEPAHVAPPTQEDEAPDSPPYAAPTAEIPTTTSTQGQRTWRKRDGIRRDSYGGRSGYPGCLSRAVLNHTMSDATQAA